ncbi:MAG: cysteine desulfurase [Oscillospiraceae bacterium]|nr:cysteine desulfurase [Oscillospiraceae bacterium]
MTDKTTYPGDNMTYLDNAATTRVSENAAQAVMDAMRENYGNPSSLHRMGLDAELIVTDARKTIAKAISAAPETITFTSGATEANNTLLRGAAKVYGRRKNTIVATSIEHPSVEETLKALEQEGFIVKRVKPRADGSISLTDYLYAVDNDTFLATCMYVNNETGAINDVADIFSSVKLKAPDCITHTDAVQAFMKIPMKVTELDADLITFSGHKIHAPKGVGAMYIRKGLRIPPIMTGGGQEKGLRSGTEAVPLIAGFGAAVKEQLPQIDVARSNAVMLGERLRSQLSELPYVKVNSGANCSPYIVNISVEGIRSEIMLHFLESRHVYVSSGSACSKGKHSRVLSEMGMSDKQADTALRISFSKMSSWGEIEQFVSALKEGYMSLEKIK